MVRGRVLLIADDEWALALLRKYFFDAKFEVEVARAAREGFQKAREIKPDCVLCAVELPDIDGFWVARRLRAESSDLARTPMVLLAGSDDLDSRVQGLSLGADLVLMAPYREEEVVAQVTAVMDMASRLRRERSSSEERLAGSAAFEGDLSGISLTTLLTLLDMERRAGTLTIAADQVAVLELNAGEITAASLGGDECRPIDVVRTCFGWPAGRFQFSATANPRPATSGERISALLLHVMQSVDESDRDPNPW